MRSRFAFALRAFIVTALVAIILAVLWYFIFDVANPNDLPRYAFWSTLMAGFVAIFTAAWSRITTWPRGLRFAASLFIGMGFGFLFCFVAAFPGGLILRRIELPVMLLWPMAGMVGVGFAASEAQKTRRDDDTAFASIGMIGIGLLYVIAVKSGLNQIPEPLDFARYNPEPPVPHIDKPFVAQKPQQSSLCTDTVRARSLAEIGIVMDSSVNAKPLGVFSDVRVRADGKRYGHRLTLWRVLDDLVGIADTYSGGEPAHAMIEVRNYAPNEYKLAYDAYYEDDYFDSFDGSVYPGSVTGKLRISQIDCANQQVANEDVTLTRDSVASRQMFGAGSDKTFAQLTTSTAPFYRRVPRPTYPDPPSIDGVINIAPRFWHPEGTSAGAYTGKFTDNAQMKRWLSENPELLFARTQDTTNHIASWVAIGSTRELQLYTSKLFKAYAAKDGFAHFAYSKVPVVLAIGDMR